MKVLNDNELERVTGGAIGTTTLIVLIGIGVVSLVVFLSGVFNGQIRLKWQNLKNIEFIRNLREKRLILIRRKDWIMFIKLLDLMHT